MNGSKECGQCGLILPVDQFNKARSHYSSRCKKCVSEYMKLYRGTIEYKNKLSEYHKEYRKDNRQKLNDRIRVWRKTEKGKASRNQLRRNWTLKEKKKSIAYKGGKCLVCGYNKCESALEFHHLDPDNKIDIKDHWSFIRSVPELDKCVLLCCRCHRELHSGIISL